MPSTLVDLGAYPEIYADGIGDLQMLAGNNTRMVLFSWRKLDGVYRKVITGMVIRPAATLCHPMQWEEVARTMAPPLLESFVAH